MTELKLNKEGVLSFLGNTKIQVLVLFCAILVVWLQKMALPDDSINNFKIFRASFFHLLNYKTLYGEYKAEYYDLFLYGPVFSVLIAPFALLNIKVALLFWYILNAGLLFLALHFFPISKKAKTFVFYFSLLELITALQNSQVNPLIAAWMLFAFIFFEKQQVFWAAGVIMLAFFIKIFGIVAACLFLIYPQKIRFILYCMLWSVIYFSLPLLFINQHQLIFLYQDWFKTLVEDSKVNIGVSFIGCIYGILKWEVTPILVQLFGVVLFLTTYIYFAQFRNISHRIYLLCAALIWCVIFNHAAESSTYIPAVMGAAIWFSISSKKWDEVFLISFCFILTVLSPTDFFPRDWLNAYVKPYSLKALPCVFIWFYLTYSLTLKTIFNTQNETENNS